MSSAVVRHIFHPDQYCGEETIGVDFWGAGPGPDPTTAERRRSFDRWAAFFETITPIRDLSLGRVTDPVLSALASQTRLTSLRFGHGPYTDLTPLKGMAGLTTLVLGGATQLVDLRPLAHLRELDDLEIENARRLRDYSALGELSTLRRLVVQRSFTGPRTDADSLEFLAELSGLREFAWDPRVITGDYSPVVGLGAAHFVAITAMKGMSPSMADLEWELPGMQAYARQLAEHRSPVFSSDGEVRMMSHDVQGRLRAERIDEDEAADLWVAHEPFATRSDLRGPIAGRTIRTIISTPRTRIEDFWLSLEVPVVENDAPVPPPDHRALGSFPWAGSLREPLLAWDAHLPSGASPAEYFGGNLDVWLPAKETRLHTSHLPPLPDDDFQRIVETLRQARGRRHVVPARAQLDAEADDFVLRFAETVGVRAVALAPVADELVALGTIRSGEIWDAIGSLITAGDDVVRAALRDPRSVRTKDLHPTRDAIFSLAEEVMRRRRRDPDLTVVTSYSEMLASRSLSQHEGGSGPALDEDPRGVDDVDGDSLPDDEWPVDVRAGRAVVNVDGRLRERIVLADCAGVGSAEIHPTIRAAIIHFGGTIEAGPEVASVAVGELHGSAHMMRIRRRSALALDDYVARYSPTP